MKYLGEVRFTQDKTTIYKVFKFYKTKDGRIVLNANHHDADGIELYVTNWKEFWDLYIICHRLPWTYIEHINFTKDLDERIVKEVTVMQI